MTEENHNVAFQVMEMSDDISEIAKAMPKAQAAMGDVFKNANNPAFRSKYADLAAVVEAVLPALNSCGIALLQPTTGLRDGSVHVATMLLHESGQWLRCVMAITTAKTDAHGIGSAVTYGRRFGLQAMSGVAPTDDDGNAASHPHGQQPQQRPQTQRREETKQQTAQDRVEAVMQAAKNAKTSQEVNAIYERSTGLRNELPKEERVKLEAFLVERTAELDANNPFDKP